MRIRNVVHKGLRRFIEDDDATGLQAAVVPKVRRIVTFLQDMEREDELRTVPSWKPSSAHRRSERHMEPVRHQELADHVPDRPNRNRDHRPRL